MTRPVILHLSDADRILAERLASAVGGVREGGSRGIKPRLRSHFSAGRPIVAIMATGAVVRLLAPLLDDKRAEPPVVCVAADGSVAVPLLGGHGGANELAQRIEATVGARACITTAGDVRFGIALDRPPPGYRLANPADAKAAMAALAAGATAKLEGHADWLAQSGLPLAADGTVTLTVTEAACKGGGARLVYHPATLVLGMGCERGASPDEAIGLCRDVLREAGLAAGALAAVASIDLKADEAAVHAVAAHFGVPARFFDAARLEQEAQRLASPSRQVFAEVGCHGVAEGAALAGAGTGGELVVAKRKSRRATAALARACAPVVQHPGRERGRLFVLGIGPGQACWRSGEAVAMIDAATDLVGYSLYLDLVDDLANGKRRHDFPLGAEEKRVRHAMELAGQGRDVALVCSGDAGIYAMATLVFELLEKGGLSDAARRIAIEVSPGISALQAAAARAGAPLGHDFCTVSLSDLLTPWPEIERRLEAAARGDFAIAFYNPVSRRRRTQLAHAREVLLRHRPATTPVVLASNLGRPGEAVRVVTLAELEVDDVDMLTVVLVGSSQTRTVAAGDGRRWVYTPRGYAAKDGTGIETPAESREPAP